MSLESREKRLSLSKAKKSCRLLSSQDGPKIWPDLTLSLLSYPDLEFEYSVRVFTLIAELDVGSLEGIFSTSLFKSKNQFPARFSLTLVRFRTCTTILVIASISMILNVDFQPSFEQSLLTRSRGMVLTIRFLY